MNISVLIGIAANGSFQRLTIYPSLWILSIHCIILVSIYMVTENLLNLCILNTPYDQSTALLIASCYLQSIDAVNSKAEV